MMSIISIAERHTLDINVLPWTPDKIVFKSGGIKYTAYNVMDVGEIKQAIGTNLFSVSWDSRFPGQGNQNHEYLVTEWVPWVDPEYYQGMFSKWKTEETKLQLMITGTPIYHNVTLSDYEVTYKEGNGDYYYHAEFLEDRDVSFTATIPAEEISDTIERDMPPQPTIYTVVEGDTLWGIAQRFLGDGMRHGEIYSLNADVIEETAQKHGFSSSENGWWIFPGTVLKIDVPSGGDSTAGAAVELSSAPIYVSSDASNVAARITGTYYLYDGINILGRYRITDKKSLVNVKPVNQNVIGWLDQEYV